MATSFPANNGRHEVQFRPSLPPFGLDKEPTNLGHVEDEISLDRQHAMPKNSNKQRTPEDDKRLLELSASGKPHAMIGVALGRSTGSIVGRLSLLNTRSRSTKSRDPGDG
jgi:hypothetical protein